MYVNSIMPHYRMVSSDSSQDNAAFGNMMLPYTRLSARSEWACTRLRCGKILLTYAAIFSLRTLLSFSGFVALAEELL